MNESLWTVGSGKCMEKACNDPVHFPKASLSSIETLRILWKLIVGQLYEI
jgi:hypothetical protein